MIEEYLNKVICADSLEFMKKLPDKCIDLVVTSPPYDGLRDYNGYSFDFEGIARELFRIIVERGVVVWVVGDACIDGSESGTSFRQALYFKEIGFNLHDTMIYLKNSNPLPENNRYFQTFEYMLVLSKGVPLKFNPIKDRKNKNTGLQKSNSSIRNKNGSTNITKTTVVKDYGSRKNVWEYDIGFMKSTNEKFAFEHPAMFPEKLAADHILSWSNEGDIVLDPFNGSGTTTKMAKHLNRNYIGIEISEKYCKIANDRLRQEILL